MNIMDILNKNSGYPELDEWARSVYAHKYNLLGYPCNEDIALSEFNVWYAANGLSQMLLDNVGDPFSEPSSAFMSGLKYEREVIEYFAPFYGIPKEDVWGIVTNSGTDGNNHGIYFGANILQAETGKIPILYVSDEAHYSNARLADLQHLDLRLIKSDKMGHMIPEELEKNLDLTRPALIVYAMGSTFKGAIDDIPALNAVLDRHPEVKTYRHIDGALFGGYLPFSEASFMVNLPSIKCDSIAVSGHKFFGIDTPCGFFISKKEVYAKQTSREITYLNSDMRMINCSRPVTAPLKFWWLIRKQGAEVWRKQALELYYHSFYLQSEMERIGWPCWRNHLSNTIFFKRPSQGVIKYYNLALGYDEQFGGELAHVVVMQHVTNDLIDKFVSDLKSEIR